MAWRMLMRRCPGRSMTIVGDVAQTGDLAGASSWASVLERVPGRTVAAGRADHQLPDPGRDHGGRGRRAGRDRPGAGAAALGARDRRRAVAAGRGARPSWPPAWRTPRRQAASAPGEGQLAVIVPAARLDELAEAVAAPCPVQPSASSRSSSARWWCSPSAQAKGLEFDSVLIADPAGILAESPRGLNDLYVALTRATQRLGVVHAGELPAVLARLSPIGDLVASRLGRQPEPIRPDRSPRRPGDWPARIHGRPGGSRHGAYLYRQAASPHSPSGTFMRGQRDGLHGLTEACRLRLMPAERNVEPRGVRTRPRRVSDAGAMTGRARLADRLRGCPALPDRPLPPDIRPGVPVTRLSSGSRSFPRNRQPVQAPARYRRSPGFLSAIPGAVPGDRYSGTDTRRRRRLPDYSAASAHVSRLPGEVPHFPQIPARSPVSRPPQPFPEFPPGAVSVFSGE